LMLAQLIKAIPNLLRLLYCLVRDHRVPLLEKIVFLAAVAYVFCPLDIIPDLLPLAGQVDDFLLMALAVQRLLNAAGAEIAGRYWGGSPSGLTAIYRILNAILFFLPPGLKRSPGLKRRDQDVIDVEYRFKE